VGGKVQKEFLNIEMSEAAKIKQHFETTLKGVREEFDEHLESINDNTNEVQANYEYISKIEVKMHKLTSRLDQLESWMSRFTGIAVSEEEDPRIDLNEKEKRVFLILYTATDTELVTYEHIAKSLGENDFLIRGYITNMLEKGIPIQKRYVERQVYLNLDTNFKEKQAKHNLLGISQTTVKEFLR